jgi:hypothetical protein
MLDRETAGLRVDAMTTFDDTGVHHLVVTGAAADSLFERFSQLYRGRTDVVVVKDRRKQERRRSARGPGDGERRQSDRRTRTPWQFPPTES